MIDSLYNPFEDLIFDEHFCFLSGALTNETISVFPEWLLEHFKFADERIEMMDKTKAYKFGDLKMPCSSEVKTAFDALDTQFRAAYEKGYEGMAELDEEVIFQWTGRIVYGLLYQELVYEKNRLARQGKEFGLSPFLKDRFSHFHLMLQSLIAPVTFGERKPWSIAVFPLKYSADIFSYRDDTVNLLFSMGVNGFGMVVCFQDNGAIGERLSDILEKIDGQTLHPIQFEELYAHFHYSDYILQAKPEYNMQSSEDGVRIESLPMKAANGKDLFGFWDDDMFAQLLANYWSVYGIPREEILQFQKPRLSYLEAPYSGDFIPFEAIDLPY